LIDERLRKLPDKRSRLSETTTPDWDQQEGPTHIESVQVRTGKPDLNQQEASDECRVVSNQHPHSTRLPPTPSHGHHQDSSEEYHLRSHNSSGHLVSPGIIDKQSSFSSSEVMPRNDKPPAHGPSPTGNNVTNLVNSAAPSTLVVKVHGSVEGISAGSGASQPTHNSKHEEDETRRPPVTEKKEWQE
jgi:hypothetical protein